MSVTLSPEAETRIQHWIDRGHFATIDEALDAAIDLLDEHNRLARLKAAIASAKAQITCGEGIPMTPEFWDEIEREADEADQLGLPINPDVCG